MSLFKNIDLKDEFVKNDLINGEEIVFSGNITKFIYLRAVPFLLFLPFFYFLNYLVNVNISIVYILFTFGFIYTIIESFIYLKTTEIVLTNKRIITKVGLIQRNINEVNLEKIESFNINQNIIQRLLNFGNIEVHGIGKTSINIKGIESPLIFKKKSMEELFKIKKEN